MSDFNNDSFTDYLKKLAEQNSSSVIPQEPTVDEIETQKWVNNSLSNSTPSSEAPAPVELPPVARTPATAQPEAVAKVKTPNADATPRQRENSDIKHELMKQGINAQAFFDSLPVEYGDDLNDAALKEAQNRQKDMQGSSLLGRGLNTISSAIARDKPDNSFYDAMDKMSGQDAAHIMERRGAKDKEIKRHTDVYNMASEKERANPGSPVSKLVQDVAVKMGMKPEVVAGMSAQSIEKVLPPIERYFQSKENAKDREVNRDMAVSQKKNELDDRNKRFNLAQAERYQKAAQQTEFYKAGSKVKLEMNNIRNIMDDAFKNGGQSLSMLGTKLAKAAGEVGVLTENDVKRYIQNPAYAPKIWASLNKASTGKLTKID